MKKKFLFFVLLFTLFTLLFMFFSCAKENKNFEGLAFEDKSVMYDGQAHSLEVTGAPDFAKVSYTANSFIQVGVYEVTATVTAEGYNDWVKKANLSILAREDEVSVEGFEFDWKEFGKEYKITGYTGEEAILYIPDTFNGLPVTEIGDMAFSSNDKLTSIVLPEGIVRIGEKAFSGCHNLFEVFFPSTLKSIGANAFLLSGENYIVTIKDIESYCKINFENKYSNPLYYVGFLFLDGKILEGEIRIPDGIKKISEYAFAWSTQITKVILPDSVEIIEDFAFGYCSNLTEINIPENIKYIGEYALGGSAKLNLNEYDNGYYLGSEKNPYCVLYDSKDTAITEIEIHPDTMFVYSGAFSQCNNLSSVTIPENVISVGDSVFYEASKLKTINLPASLKYIWRNTFYRCDSLEEIRIPSLKDWLELDILDPYSYNNYLFDNENTKLIVDGKILEDMVISDDIEKISNYAFNNYRYLKSITIQGDVNKIEERAFYNCQNLKNIYISGNVSKISERAFSSCNQLEEVLIEGKVNTIGEYVFEQCYNLKSVELNEGVEIIEEGAFCYTNNIQSLVLPSSIIHLEGLFDYSADYSALNIYYCGSQEEFESNVEIETNNKILLERLHYYSETEPPLNEDGTAYDGQYWRYVDGVPTVWKK